MLLEIESDPKLRIGAEYLVDNNEGLKLPSLSHDKQTILPITYSVLQGDYIIVYAEHELGYVVKVKDVPNYPFLLLTKDNIKNIVVWHNYRKCRPT